MKRIILELGAGTALHGAQYTKAAVRAGFLPQFRSDYGDIQFLEEDRFIDADAGRMLVRWVCQFEWKGTIRRWRGLDILHVRDGLITE